MARFNGEESVDLKVADSLKRPLNLLYLFDHELFVDNRDSMMRQANAFIDTVISRRNALHYEDGGWFAEVGCNCIYKGKEDTLTLYLKPEKIEGFQYRWMVIGAKGKNDRQSSWEKASASKIQPLLFQKPDERFWGRFTI